MWFIYIIKWYHNWYCLCCIRIFILCSGRTTKIITSVLKDKISSLYIYLYFFYQDAAVNQISWPFLRYIIVYQICQHVYQNIWSKIGIDIIHSNYRNYGQRTALLLQWHSQRPSLIALNCYSGHNLGLLAMMAFENARSCVYACVFVCPWFSHYSIFAYLFVFDFIFNFLFSFLFSFKWYFIYFKLKFLFWIYLFFSSSSILDPEDQISDILKFSQTVSNDYEHHRQQTLRKS
jgi:hypothetical protein